MKVAIEGCAHGELEKIYDSIQYLENKENTKIDLLICCGDFQSTRNIADLRCMACPIKYQSICTFYKYYSGEKIAPILTIFIGGNHEASNYLQELPYGGWVAPNIYYLGYAGVINVGGIRIGGISGIYKGHDFLRGHFEHSPYTEETKRSVYHIRNLEVYRLKQLSGKIDVFLSHDWPRGVYHYGNVDELLKFKPYFRDDIFENKLGSKPCEDLLHHLQPSYWFAAHLHCKFAALVPHQIDKTDDEGNTIRKNTKFLALDKCLPKRKFLQIVDIPCEQDATKKYDLSYDLEWLTILQLTNHLLNIKSQYQYMPDANTSSKERSNFTPTNEEKQTILEKFSKNLIIPLNFQQTAEPYNPNSSTDSNHRIQMPNAQTNKQTEEFCAKLGIDDPLHLVLLNNSNNDNNLTDNSSLPNYLTPERKTNQSYNDNESSLIFTPSSVERNSIKRLSLPAPKDDSVSIDKNDESESKNSNEISSIDQEIDNSKGNSFSQKSNDCNPSDLNPSPQPTKKFKRRNASLYENS